MDNQLPKIDILEPDEITASGLRIRNLPRDLLTVKVFPKELKHIGTANRDAALKLCFFGISAGIFVSTLVALVAALCQVPISNLYVAICVAVAVPTGFMSVFFGLTARTSWKNADKEIEEILTESSVR